MKKITMLFMVSFSLLLFGCSTQEKKEPKKEETPVQKEESEVLTEKGYVVKKSSDSILVVSSEPDDFNKTGGMKESYDAIWFSNVPESIQTGMKVEVTVTGPIRESYPAQAEADKVVEKEVKIEGTKLKYYEAVSHALEQKKNKSDIVAVTEVEYIKEKNNWHVTLKAFEEETEEVFIFEDKK